MAVINIPASKSLTLSNRFPTGNMRNKKIMVGNERKDTYYSYLFFDISRIPSNIVLVSAVLVLFKVADFFAYPTKKFAVYPLLKQFSSFTTYENNCPVDLNPALKQEFLPFTKDVAIEIDITPLFHQWLSNTLVNNGIVIKDGSYRKPCIWGHTCFGSAYNKDNTLIPFIRVNFRQNSCCWLLPKDHLSYTATVLPTSKNVSFY